MNNQEFEVVKRAALQLKNKRYLGRLYEEGDLYGAGWQAVIEAHEKFGDAVPENLLHRIVQRRMVDHIRTLNKRCEEVPLEDDNEIVDQYKTDWIDDEELEHMTRMLSKKEQNVVSMYLQAELTHREIGEVLGLSERRIGQIFQRIVPLILQ